MTVSYTVTVSVDGVNTARTFYSYLPGTVKWYWKKYSRYAKTNVLRIKHRCKIDSVFITI
jgi:hypothetical protein